MSSFELAKNAFLNGLALLEQQQFAQAEAAFQESLIHAPDRPSTLINLSITLINQAKYQEAKNLLDKLIQIEPGNPEAHFYLGLTNKQLHLFPDAIVYLEKATEISPQFLDAWLLKADLFEAQQLPLKSLACYEALLAIKPDFLQAWKNMGFLLSELNQPEKAINAYSRAIELEPNDADIYFANGSALSKLERHDEALISLQRAIQLQPSFSKAYAISGTILSKKGSIEEALQAYQATLNLDPQDFQTWSNQGVALHAINNPEKALAAYDKAIHINPQYAEAWSNKGITLNHLQRYEEALAAYDKAIGINPQYAEAWFNKGITLNDMKRYEEALEAYDFVAKIKPDMDLLLGTRMHLKMRICDWKDYDSSVKSLKDQLEIGKNAIQPFPLLALIDDLSLQQRAAQNWINSKASERNFSPLALPSKKNQKIRIGYFSADFRIHPVAFLIAGLIQSHNRDEFEIFGFSYGPNTGDEVRQRLEKSFDQFIDISDQSDLEVATLSRNLGIDIAVDLTGITQFNRLGIFAHRAAPIQINYLGYPGTSGAKYFDYILGDATVIKPTESKFFSEKIIYLPNAYQANDNKRVISQRVFTRTELGLPEEGFIYCCFNNNYKITPHIFDAWVRILNRVPKSVLWLFEDNKSAKNNLKANAAAKGVDSSRLIFAEHMSPADHLARQRLAGLFLDTSPYNAHTTASDALWAGLPVLTKMGRAFPGRVAASLLKAINLPELITYSDQEYEDLAVELGSNPKKVTLLCKKLEANIKSEPLFNTELFTRNLEQIYKELTQT